LSDLSERTVSSRSRKKAFDRGPGIKPDRTRVISRPSSSSTLPRDLGLALAMYASSLLAYWPALRGGKIWDDKFQITPPSFQSLHGLWRIWAQPGAASDYYPLFHSAFWVEHRLWGDSVLGYHLANLTEHAVAAFLVVLIVRRLALPGAWLAGMLFALHPVNVESVAWMAEQKNTLSAMFYMASALTYLHFDRGRRRSQYLLASGLFVLALLSKSVTATLPPALLVVFWWQRGRITWRHDALPLLPWFVVGAAFGLFTGLVEWTIIGASGKGYDLTLVQHILLAGRIPFFYASKILWPANLTFTYPRWQLNPAVWWQYLYPLALLILIAALVDQAWRSNRREQRAPLAAFLFFLGTLFPMLGLLHIYYFRFSFVADHFQYLASLGILVPVACTLTLTVPRFLPWKHATIVVEIMLLAVLGLLTWRQCGMYKDAKTLYRVTLARNPGSFMAHCNLGWLLAESPGGLPDAIAEFQAALRIQPNYAIAHNDLGIAWIQTPGHLQDAISEFQAALRIQPNYANAHMNLGNVWLQLGKLQDAIAEYQATIRIEPDSAKAHANMGNALVQAGRLPEAIAQYQAALRIRPDSAAIHKILGVALVQAGRLTEAIAELQAALEQQPNDANTHELLGNALAQMPGRQQDAIAQYEAVIELRPDSPDARNARQAITRLQAQEVGTQHQLGH
jgi:tetratricopeptide (TPR) repeat protein